MSLKHKLEKSIARARKGRDCAYAGREDAECDPDRSNDLELIYLEGGDMGMVYFCSAHRNHAFTMAADCRLDEGKKLLAFGKNFVNDPRKKEKK